MIKFFRPFSYTGRNLLGHLKKSKNSCRFAYTVKYRNLDKESYLNRRSIKESPNYHAALTLVVPAIAFGMALWQVDRKIWKDKLVDDMKLRTRIPPVELPEDLSDRRKLEYRRFRVRGTFDHSKEIFVGPRSLIVDQRFHKSKQFLFPVGEPEKPNIGYIVITPFKLADRDLTILINRGWIPMDQKDPQTRLEAQIEGEVEIEGILRLKENKPTYSGKVHPSTRILRYRDLDRMVELTGSSYVYLDAIEETSIPGGPIGGQTQVNLKNDHLEYIMTWLAIGLYTSWMWHKRFIKKTQ